MVKKKQSLCQQDEVFKLMQEDGKDQKLVNYMSLLQVVGIWIGLREVPSKQKPL